jgi:hypothetical protein
MSQDQWDLHKLDSDYECSVTAIPNMTTIKRKKPTMPTTPTGSDPPPFSSSTLDTDIAGTGPTQTTPGRQPKKDNPRVTPETSSEPDPHSPKCPSVAMADPSDSDSEDIIMADEEISFASHRFKGIKRTRSMKDKQAASGLGK